MGLGHFVIPAQAGIQGLYPFLLSYYSVSKTKRTALLKNTTQLFQKVVSISVVPENLRTFDSPGDNVMQSPRCIYLRLPCHDKHLSQQHFFVNWKTKGRPPNPKQDNREP